LISPLKPYLTLKDPGLAWLGVIPAHWSVKRGKVLFQCIDVRSEDGEEELLTVSAERGVVPRSSATVTMFKAESYKGYKLCWPGDLVINSLWAWGRGLGVSQHHGIVSSAYGVYRLRPQYAGYPAYIHELVRSVPFNWELHVRSKGIWISRLQLTDDAFLNAPFLIPPADEAAAIVRFLDHADRRIRRYIRAKQKLIKLLDEQKQNVIHCAVTRGLDPNVRLKAPDVEGLPCIPEHWAVRSFTRMAIERADYRGATPAKKDTGVFLVTARNVRKGWIDYHVSQEFVAEADYNNIMRRGLPRLGDLLLTMEAPLGHAALVDREDIALAQRVVRFRFDPRVLLPRFVLMSVLSPYFQDQLLRRGTGSTALGIKASKLPQLRLVFPPVDEQQALLDYIDSECKPMDAAALRARTEIDLLREYRTRLIADVVTGKVDVREAAAGLSEDLEEPEAFDEDGLDTDSEEAEKEGEAVDAEAEA
jgi:type I restriction enzyme S subunit